MSTKKAGGSTRLGRESNAQRLGVKLYGGERAKAGSIIIRQRGSRYRPGLNAKIGKDDTIFATAPGLVSFTKKKIKKFTGKLSYSQIVNVLPIK